MGAAPNDRAQIHTEYGKPKGWLRQTIEPGSTWTMGRQKGAVPGDRAQVHTDYETLEEDAPDDGGQIHLGYVTPKGAAPNVRARNHMDCETPKGRLRQSIELRSR